MLIVDSHPISRIRLLACRLADPLCAICERRRKNGTNVGIKVGQWVGVVTAYRGPAEESWEKGVTTHGTQYRPFASQAREEPAPDRERAGPEEEHGRPRAERAGRSAT